MADISYSCANRCKVWAKSSLPADIPRRGDLIRRGRSHPGVPYGRADDNLGRRRRRGGHAPAEPDQVLPHRLELLGGNARRLKVRPQYDAHRSWLREDDGGRRGIERGVFQIAHVWLGVAAIGAMGTRVAYWYTPEFELISQCVAEVYAQFALRLLGAPEPTQRGAC